MPVPTQPTREDVILQGMIDAGQYLITNTSPSYTIFLASHWETLKTEIWNACRTDRFLESTACVVVPVGQSTVTLPTDFDNEISLVVYDAQAPYRGTAQAGGLSTSLTLASTFTATPADLFGRYIFTLAGAGAGQFRQITAYNDTTKILTVDSAWAVTTDNTTQYLIGIVAYQLMRADYVRPLLPSYRPTQYMRLGTGIQVFPAGDQLYPILMTYRANLTRMNDTTDATFLKHLQERRYLWSEGVKTRTMSRYDDDRYQAQKAYWDKCLQQYGAQNVVYATMVGHR